MAQTLLASGSFLKEEYLNTLILWALKWTFFFSFPQVFFKEVNLQESSFTLPWISGAGGFTCGVYSTLDEDCKLQGVRQFSLPAVGWYLSIVDFTPGWYLPHPTPPSPLIFKAIPMFYDLHMTDLAMKKSLKFPDTGNGLTFFFFPPHFGQFFNSVC